MILPFLYRLFGYRPVIDRTDVVVRRVRAQAQAALDGLHEDVRNLSEVTSKNISADRR